MISAGPDEPTNQLELLLQELGMLETQQNKLRNAVKHNKGIVIHPRQEVGCTVHYSKAQCLKTIERCLISFTFLSLLS